MFVCGKLKSYFPFSAWAPGIPQRTLISQSWQMNIQNNQANQLSIKAATVKALPWRLLTSLNCWSWERKGDTWTCRIAPICSCLRQQRSHSHDLSCCFSAALSAIYMRCGIWLVKKSLCDMNTSCLMFFAVIDAVVAAISVNLTFKHVEVHFLMQKKAEGNAVHPRERGFDSICSQI